MEQSLAERRRKYFNDEFARQTTGVSMKNKVKSKLMKKIWSEAKRKIK